MRQTAESPLRLLNPRRVFYGWWLVGITMFITAMAHGPLLHGAGFLMEVLKREFGWSQMVLSVPWSLNRAAEGALLGPIEGFLTDRYGTRRMVLAGFVILGAGAIAFSFIQNVPGYYIAVAVLWLGAGLAGSIPLMTALNHWFSRHLTKAIAIGQMGGNLGVFLVPALIGAIEAFGWRATTLWAGIAFLGIAIPIFFLVRNRPEQYGLRPDGDPAPQPSEATLPSGVTPSPTQDLLMTEDPGFTTGEALRTWAFWAISGANACAVAAALTVILFIVPSLLHQGVSPLIAGAVVATYGWTSVPFRLVGGFIGDRLPKRPAIAFFIAVQAAGVLAAALFPTILGAFVFAVLFGIGFGGRGPLFVAIRGEYFGRRNFASIMGISSVPSNLTFVTPIAVGWAFDQLGSYTIPFLVLAVVNFAGAGLVLLAKKPEVPASRRA